MGALMIRQMLSSLAIGALSLAAAVPASAQGAAPPQPLLLRDAVRLALERNLDLSVQRLEPLINQAQVREASGEFDPLLILSLSYGRQERLVNSTLEETAESGLIVDQTLNPDGQIIGRLPTGTQYNLSLTTPSVNTNNPNRLFDHYYYPVINFGLTQPLLRDFGIETNLVRVRKAEKLERESLLGIEANMLSVIREVESRYWAVSFFQKHVEVTQGTLALAQDLVERLTRLRNAGLATDLDLLDARAVVEARKGDVARAETELTNARAQLRLVVDPRADLGTSLAAAENPAFEGTPVDLAGMLARGLVRRPEIRAQEAAIERLALDEHAARNNTQPRLDAIGNLGWNGLAGSPLGPNVRGDLPSRLQGQESYWDAFRGFFTPDGNVSWSVGMRLQVAVGNREAQGKLDQAKLRRRQGELRLAQARSQVGADVETAFHEVAAESVRYLAAKESVDVARMQLAARERELGAGLATVRKVLEAQDVLALSQDRQNQALVNYATARARLNAAQAETLDTYRLTRDQ